MSELRFSVPLDKLVSFSPSANRTGTWWCEVGRRMACSPANNETSREAAEAAAVQHLADVHGIRPAVSVVAELRRLIDKEEIVLSSFEEPVYAVPTEDIERRITELEDSDV